MVSRLSLSLSRAGWTSFRLMSSQMWPEEIFSPQNLLRLHFHLPTLPHLPHPTTHTNYISANIFSRATSTFSLFISPPMSDDQLKEAGGALKLKTYFVFIFISTFFLHTYFFPAQMMMILCHWLIWSWAWWWLCLQWAWWWAWWWCWWWQHMGS